MKKVYKYGTGQDVPSDAVYLWSCKNGQMGSGIEFVWHYFLVEA